jgi:hypothetical protein
MTSPSAETLAPHIDIAVRDGEAVITQQRPALVSSLVGMSVSRAMAFIPTLLPICGQAQSLAAQRAVAAARGESEVNAERQAQPWREQAFAAAWRLSIDWPERLGEAHRMDALGRVHRAPDDVVRAAALAQTIPGLDAVQSLDQLLDWVRASNCVAAGVARRALDVGGPLSGVECLGEDALATLASEALAAEDFNALDPVDGALEVGPLAMARDPLVAQLQAELGTTLLARVLAQILDTRFICRALDAAAGAAEPETNAWSAAGGVGVGRAITSRGPVFHRVCLDGGADRAVLDWRVLAPTDWHFAAGGPVALALPQMDGEEAMKLLVTSYDPCAPWSLHTGPGEGSGRA